MDRLTDLCLLLAKLGLFSIGGSPTVLGDMQRDMVDRGWLTPEQFATAFALSQVVPGPPTVVVIPLGYLVAGFAGAALALVAFAAPTTAIALITMQLWSRIRQSPWAVSVRTALAPVATGLVLASVYTLGRSGVRQGPMLLVGTGVFVLVWRGWLSASLAVPLGIAIGIALAIAHI